MATLYWVGGSGVWDNFTATNWALSSGGAGGAGIPTSADNVIFDSASGATNFIVSIGFGASFFPSCANFTQSISTAGRITFSGGGFLNGINCYGTPTINAATVIDAASPIYLDLVASSGSITANLNNVRFYQIFFGDGLGGTATYTLGSGITTSFVNLRSGTLNTNNQTVTVTSQYYYAININCSFSTSTFDAKTLTLGTSAINVGASASEWPGGTATFDLETGGSAPTLNANTSTITVGSTNTTNWNYSNFYGSGLTYRAVVLNGAYSNITSPNTFYAFTKNAVFNDSYLKVYAPQTATNSFVLSGTAAVRLLIFSDESRTQRTFTLTGTATRTLNYVSFMDIALSYSASVTGTSVGNFGGNSGITFTAAVTRYLVLGGVNKNFSSTTAWSATSGGATGATAPLPQDTVIMNGASGTGNLAVDGLYLGTTINTTGFLGTSSLGPNSLYVFGQPNDAAGILAGYIGAIIFRFDSNIVLPTFLPNSTLIDGGSATATMSASDSISGGVYVLSGNFNTNSYNLTAFNFSSSSYTLTEAVQSRGIITSSTYTFGSSLISLSDSSFALVFQGVDTVNANTSTVQLTSTSSTVSVLLSNQTLYNLKLTPGSASIRYTGLGGATYNNITLDAHTSLIQLDLNSGTTTTVGSMNVNGTKGAGVIIGANLGTALNGLFSATLAIGSNIVTEYVAFLGVAKSGASTLSARGAADLGGNSGISFQQHSVIAFSGSGATSFTVPGNFTGSSYFVVIGAGGGAGKRNTSASPSGGAGSGAIAVSTNLNISVGQTIYLNSPTGGAGATAPVGGNGGSPANAWVNIAANSQPTLATNGAYADSGSGSGNSSTSGSPGGSLAGSLGQLEYAGATGGSTPSGNGGGAGGAAPGTLLFRAGKGVSTNSNFGGSGGSSYQTFGSGASGTNGGVGGLVGANPGGTAGVGGAPPTAGGNGAAGTSVGGGGGGARTTSTGSGAAGGNGASGDQWTYNSLNGVAGSGAIGYGGGGGGGGGYSGSIGAVVGGAGGNGSIGAGGGSGGRGTTVANNGSGGNGGDSLVLFVYVENRGGTFATIIG